MNISGRHELTRIQREYSQCDSAVGSGSMEIYRYTNPAFMFHIQEREWAILSMLKAEHVDLSQDSVLEVGCGTGHILQRFIEFGAREVTGIDLMENRIQMGKRMFPALHLTQGNASQLP